MSKARVLKYLLPAFAALILAQPAMAERQNPYNVMAHSAWSAFQCSVLAEKARNMSEQKRLFEFGYDQGMKFIKALESGTAKKEELANTAPISMLLLQGPTPDFALGRIFEAALRSALEDVFTSAAAYDSEAVQESMATREFWKRNCSLVGK